MEGLAIQNAGNMAAMLTNNTLEATVNVYRNIYVNVEQTNNMIQQNIGTQIQFNEAVEEGEKKAGGLKAMLEKCKAALPGMAEKIGQAFSMSDDLAKSTAQLNMINRAQGTTEQLQQQIFESAQRTGTAYQQTADMAVKLGTGTGEMFASNNELVDFTEQLNKAFTISGMDSGAVDGAVDQLAQAFGSGEVDSGTVELVMQNQPMAENLQRYLEEIKGVDAGSLQQLAAEGAIVAEDIKNSMLYAMDETNGKFASMPMTFGQISNQLANQGQQALQPLLQEIGRLAQSQGFQEMITSLGEAMVQLTPIVSEGIGLMVDGLAWLVDNWSQLAPIVLGVVGAYEAYTIATNLQALATLFLGTANDAANASMLASPIFWIAMVIIAIVVAIYQWIQSVGGLQAAWLICVNAVLTVIENMQLFFMAAVIRMQGLMDQLVYGFEAVKVGVLNAIGNMKVRGLMMLQNFINGTIDMINLLIEKLNMIPGVSIEAVGHVEFATKAQAEEEAARQEREAGLQQKKADMAAKQEERQHDYNQKAAAFAANRAERTAKIREVQEESARKKAEENAGESNYVFEKAGSGANAETYSAGVSSGGGNALTAPVNSIEQNTAAIASEMDQNSDDLSELRNAAEEEIINRFTTAELTVNMGGITNQVNSNMDLDGIANYLDETINGVLLTAAEGVY